MNIKNTFKSIFTFLSRKETTDYIIYVLLFPTLFLILYILVNHHIFSLAYWKAGDEAALGIQILRAKNFEELLGSYSRWGWNHPGPISLYYLAFMDYLLPFSSDHGRHIFGQLIFNYFFILCSLHLIYTTFKDNKHYTILFFLTLLFVLWPLGIGHYSNIWNPHVLVILIPVFLLAASRVAYGSFNYILLLIISGSFISQNYIGPSVFVITISAVSLVMFVINSKKQAIPFARKNLIYLGLSGLFFIGVFSPVIYEQVTSQPGNITKILQFISTKGGPQQHPIDCLDYLFQFFSDPIKNFLPINSYIITAILMAVALFNFKKERSYFKYILIFLFISFIPSFYSVLNIKGTLPNYRYSLYYEYAIVTFFYFILLISILRYFDFKKIKRRNYLIFLVISFLIIIPGLYRIKDYNTNEYIGVFMDIIKPVKNTTYKLQVDLSSDKDRIQFVTATGVAYQLLREGYDVCVPDEWLFMYGKQLACGDKKNITTIIFKQSDKPYDKVVRKEGAYVYNNTILRIQ